MYDVTIAVCMFFAFLFAFHVLLFSLWRSKPSSFWKKTDYFWLSLSFVSFIGVAGRFNEQELRQKIYFLEQEIQIEYSSQTAWFLSLMNSELYAAIHSPEQFSNANGFRREKVRLSLAARNHVANLLLELSNNRPYVEHMQELEDEIQKIREEPEYTYVAEEATRMIERAAADETELQELRTAGVHSVCFRWFSYLTPFLLAPALALRITKVTAEAFEKP